jgi:hypothetical protein
VLVDAGSLARFRPAPGVLVALVRFIARPTERTQQGFLRQVAVDPARARALLGADAQAYGLELARTPRCPGRQPLAAGGDRGRRAPLDRAAGGVPGGAAVGAGAVMADCVVVGAGPAGLAASLALDARGVDHVVLERGRAGETWRSQRWDSFRLNTVGW